MFKRGVYLAIVLLIVLFLVINFISALCGDGQIDINSASKEELKKIIRIGPAYAERIIQNRPFNSVDELVKVNGIPC